MTPATFPIVSTVSQYSAYLYNRFLMPDGRYTTFPVGLPGVPGDSYVHVPAGYTCILKEIEDDGSIDPGTSRPVPLVAEELDAIEMLHHKRG